MCRNDTGEMTAMFFAKWRNEINDLFETRGVRLVFKILLLPIFILIKLVMLLMIKKENILILT